MNTEQERAELLPCPFCGAGTTEVRENGRPWLGTRWGEPVSVSVRHWCEPVDGQPSRMIERVGRDRAAAIDAWNRRAALQSQDREDALRYRYLLAKLQQAYDGECFESECLSIYCHMSIQFKGDRTIQAEITWRDKTDEPLGLSEAIDHARRIEGEGE